MIPQLASHIRILRGLLLDTPLGASGLVQLPKCGSAESDPQENTGEQFGEDSENFWGDAMGGGCLGGG